MSNGGINRVQQNSQLNQFGPIPPASGPETKDDVDFLLSCRRRYTFQPIYRTSGRLLGVELLTAISHPTIPHQTLSPEVYFARIDVGMRLKIVIEQMQLLRRLHDRFVRDDLLASVNIDGPVLMALQKNLQAKKLIASMPWLRFELVECQEGLPKELLNALPEASRLWLDDFGCGVANFSSLLMVRHDCIKVARELFVMLQQTEEGRQIFHLLITLMTRYCNYIVVEGVETENEWGMVKESNATAAQGYFLSRPNHLNISNH
ncbi:cyclic-guanylate-specific phosphodiesterase [Lonsdalea britannica]|uniref:Cyclic-guanylate-specific phosphodiesterase n=1 Tax=Lonsdalea britannica TaxID=1082704 RepID=A0AAD0WMB2_9GAMM|nr:cyclic-guanylate-specific phosphodiesterase [Lonsdalea britannica]